jgi:hypothetical protein
MFTPSYLAAPDIVREAMAGVVGLFFGIELCRYSSSPGDHIANYLTRYLSRFLTVEEGALKSEKVLITTHLSLLFSCFLPVFLAPDNAPWTGLSGVLSVGIGDAMVRDLCL